MHRTYTIISTSGEASTLHIATTAPFFASCWNGSIVPLRSGYVKWQRMTFLSFNTRPTAPAHLRPGSGGIACAISAIAVS